jgi:phosphatidyl-myo-inositol alpha-mannosyltransferase
MKIAIVCPYPLHTSGGVQRHILDYYQHLKKHGHYVKLVSPSDQMEMEDHLTFGVFYEVNGGKIISNGSRTYYTRTRFGKSKLPESFDIIHVHEPLHPAFFYGLNIARHNSAKKVAHIHAYNPFLTETLKLVSIPILNSIIKTFDHVIASSNVSGAPYMHSGVPVTIVPNGVETEKLGPDVPRLPEYLDGKKNIMFLGRSDERKGLKYLLQAWPAIFEHFNGNVRLIVVGGRTKEEVELMTSWADGIVGREHIIYEGGVSEERKAQLFTTSDIYVSPATGGESFGMVLNESMASGTPVVAFDNPGYRLVLEARAEYCLAKLFDVDDLTNKIIRVIEDDELRNELREWGLREVREKYDWNLITGKILDIYDGLLAQETAVQSTVANK